MINISTDQWLYFQSRGRDHFTDEVTRYMLERFHPEAGSTPRYAEFRSQIEAVIIAGEECGLESGYALLQHVLASKVVGNDYADLIPSVGQVVRSSKLSDEVKGQFLEDWLSELQRKRIGMKQPLKAG